MSTRRSLLQALVAFLAIPRATAAQAVAARVVHRQPLAPPFDAFDANFVEVTIPPGASSSAHRHSGMVLGYVLEGEFKFGVNGEAPRTLRAGETFYEAPDGVHTTSESASPDRPAKVLAIIVGEKGKPLTTPA